ncbi:MAG: energy-coupling factor ABC transporter ATP-binding protein [Spirochaetaceae bacterium]
MFSLAFERVSLRFETGVEALKELSFTLRSGEFTLVAGANGAGKSALLRVAARLLPPSSGRLTVSMDPPNWKERDFRRALRMVLQHPARQLLGQTVGEDLEIGARTAQVGERELLTEVDRFGLGGLLHRPCHALSGGEQRRVALAGALLGRPEMLLFDEPFLELDYRSTREFIALLREQKRKGVGIVLATHDYHRILAETDRMVILRRGEVAVDAAPALALERAEEYGLRPATRAFEELTWLEEGRE